MMAATTDAGGLGIRIAQIPASAENTPNARVYIVTRLLPGTTNSQRLEVSNSTDQPLNVTIYPGAATNAGGVFNALPIGQSNDLTSWTTVSPSVATIPAHSYISALVTIDVPTPVTPSEQYGVIWAATSSSQSSTGVTSVNRVGIRMYNPVGDYTATTSTSLHTSSAGTTSVLSAGADMQWLAIAVLFVAMGVFAILHYRQWRKAVLKQQRKLLKR